MRRLMMGVVVLVAGFAQAATASDVGQIKTSKGAVVVVRNGQELPGTPGTALQQSDRVVTKADGSAGITFRDDSLLSLGPDSVLDISKFSFQAQGQADELEATLHRGTLSAVSGKIVARAPEAMRIRTPTTVLGVRGTEFFVKVTNPEPQKK
ncbi:MAG: FecR family protein [Gammaproteobacteria bacterium]